MIRTKMASLILMLEIVCSIFVVTHQSVALNFCHMILNYCFIVHIYNIAIFDLYLLLGTVE